MYEKFIINRITELRIAKNLSEYQLSLELDHSKGHIQSISSKRCLPSMKSFLEICRYFDITSNEFFQDTLLDSAMILEIAHELQRFSPEDLALISTVLKRIQ